MRLRRLNALCDAWADFSDRYCVGDDGYLYSVAKNGECRQLKSGGYRGGKQYGYQQVRAHFGTGKKHTIKVHRAVALAYCYRPDGADDVDHINNNKEDNRAENLQWLTHRENMAKVSRDRRKDNVTIFEIAGGCLCGA